MAKPTNAIKGFISLTSVDDNNKPILISLQNISTVRSRHGHSLVNLTNSPFARAPQEIKVSEDYEEILRLIREASL